MNTNIFSDVPDDKLRQMSHEIQKELNKRKKHRKFKKAIDEEPLFDNRDYSGIKEHNLSIIKTNGESLLALSNINGKVSLKNKYYKSLLSQDWSSVYPCNDEFGDFYVYAHVDPGMKAFCVPDPLGGHYGGYPFYIGKGSGVRAFQLKRNQGHGKKIKSVMDEGWGHSDIVHIIFNGLSEQKAFEIESKLIYLFGTIYQKDREYASLYNLEIPKLPEFTGVMEKILSKSAFDKLKEEKKRRRLKVRCPNSLS